MKLKQKIKTNFLFRTVIQRVRNLKYSLNYVKINNKGGAFRIKRHIKGKNNHIEIGHNAFINKSVIRIIGNNNYIAFGDECYVGPGCSFWMEGNNIKIIIGAKSTFTRDVHFCAQENNSQIIIGEDCMFSHAIVVRTSDSHPIYNNETKQRINNAKSVILGRHVWIAPCTTIMKGVEIGDNAIIGSNSLVTKNIAPATLAVGMPAKEVKNNIHWTREKLF